MSNITFPKVFYTAVISAVNPKLEAFYNENVKANYYNEPYNEYAMGVLADVLYDKTYKKDLKTFASNLRRQSIRKKKRWYDSMCANIAGAGFESKRFPFPDLVARKKVLLDSDWIKLYDKTFEEIIEERTEEAKLWSEDEESLFVDFPGISSFTKAQVKKALENDILLNMMEILDEKFNMQLDEILQPYMEEMGAPIFSESRAKKELQPGETFTGEIPLDEVGTEALIVTITGDASAVTTASTTLDSIDQRLMFYIFNRAINEGIDGGFVDISYHDLARVVGNGNAGGRQYADAEERCFKIARYSYEPINKITGKQLGVINFISAAIQKENEDGSKYMSISLGAAVTDALLNNQLKRFPKYEYNKLEDNISKLLFIHLQRERIKAFRRYKAGTELDCASTFKYTDFMRWINFSTARGNKRKSMEMIRGAVEEYKAKGIMVKKVEVNNREMSMRIVFYPLTADEEEDLTMLGFEPIERVLSGN